MDNLDFDNHGFNEKIMQDGVDLLENFAEEYENKKVQKSGNIKASVLLLAIGYASLIASFFFSNVFKYLFPMVSLIIGYHVFLEKNKEKSAYKFNKTSRIIGVVLLFASVVLAFMFKYKVL
ncbi:MAG: hypothetical protein JXR68_01970 [Bacteroidales bacterium]|nr:hypothetical protein [Bacteroidales bacterium]